ncbi:MAG: hypothetical protein P8X48_13390, partial [Acidiferrobacteraceae bacterium]
LHGRPLVKKDTHIAFRLSHGESARKVCLRFLCIAPAQKGKAAQDAQLKHSAEPAARVNSATASSGLL